MENTTSTIVCKKCGQANPSESKFCSRCGTAVQTQSGQESQNGIVYCSKCGHPNDANNKFCQSCGNQLAQQSKAASQISGEDIIGEAKKFAEKAAHTIMQKANELAGEDSVQQIHLRDLFSAVFKKHTKKEQDEIFICGTSLTTPDESSILSDWPKPWLYSRILLILGLTFLILALMAQWFQNTNAIPGMIFMGALAVPFSTMIFFFEVNVPRNISIFETIKIFFVGGTLSMLACLILFTFTPSGVEGYIDAIIVGIVEEIAKLVIVAYFCKKPTVKHILTGALIGSAVGAGFAAFETAGYAFNFLLNGGWDTMMHVIYLRAALAIGGHVTWAAVSGAALVLVKKDEPLKKEHILSPKFLRLFAVPVVLHAIWDMPIPQVFYIVQITATILIWVMALVLVSVGLKQLNKTQELAIVDTASSQPDTAADADTPDTYTNENTVSSIDINV